MRSVLLLCATCLVVTTGTAFAQMPGASVPGCAIASPYVVGEGIPTNPEISPYGFPCAVYQGTVVLLEDPTKPATDQTNWSDVLVFKLAQLSAPELPGSTTQYAIYVSDNEDAAGNSNGISDADLAAAGLAPAAVLEQEAIVYLPESATSIHNAYNATGPDGVTTQYDIQSDPRENPVATTPTTWGRLKGLYHR